MHTHHSPKKQSRASFIVIRSIIELINVLITGNKRYLLTKNTFPLHIVFSREHACKTALFSIPSFFSLIVSIINA